MTAIIRPHCFNGAVRVPASKSHTIRKLIIATLADGLSEIDHPLDSLDSRSCVSVCRALGAKIRERRGVDPLSANHPDENGEKLLGWTVRGIGADDLRTNDSPASVPKRCNVGNSGTTLFLALAAASLGREPVEFDGDEQIRGRSAGSLLEALASFGVSVRSAPGGCTPITVCGPWKGGRASLPCPTSQYLSALLLAAPLVPAGAVTEIDVPLLNERPYIDMTLSYLNSQGIAYEAAPDYSYFRIPGQKNGRGSGWAPISGPVPADFSSAAFPAAAAAISGGKVTLLGLDPNDTQGDKAFFGFLREMGCTVEWEKLPPAKGRGTAEWRLTVSRSRPLTSGEFDLNDTPDLLPAMAAVACFARGDTALVNAAHARIKETDRIAVMAEELAKLGFRVSERPDGLIISGSGGIPANPAANDCGLVETDSRQDHRIAMALAAAALGSTQPVEIAGAECADVTYPLFMELLGADLV